jgi:hypothetical protein
MFLPEPTPDGREPWKIASRVKHDAARSGSWASAAAFHRSRTVAQRAGCGGGQRNEGGADEQCRMIAVVQKWGHDHGAEDLPDAVAARALVRLCIDDWSCLATGREQRRNGRWRRPARDDRAGYRDT